MFFNKGENCIAAGRIFIEESIHDEYVKRIVSIFFWSNHVLFIQSPQVHFLVVKFVRMEVRDYCRECSPSPSYLLHRIIVFCLLQTCCILILYPYLTLSTGLCGEVTCCILTLSTASCKVVHSYVLFSWNGESTIHDGAPINHDGAPANHDGAPTW